MQNESQSSWHLPKKDGAKGADVFLIVSPPPVHSVEIENPTLKPQDGFCNWCRNKPGDIFCDAWPCCFDCIELMLERENALGLNAEMYSSLPIPSEWEKH